MLRFRSLDENRYIGYKSRSSDYYDFIFEGDRIKKLEDFLHAAGVEENLVAKNTPEGKNFILIRLPLFRFLWLHQVEHALFTPISTLLKLARIFPLCLLMNSMPIITTNYLKPLSN